MTAVPLLLDDSRARAPRAPEAPPLGDADREGTVTPQRARDQPPAPDSAAALASLRQLSYLRFVAVGAQVIAMLTAHLANLGLHYLAMSAIVAALFVVNLVLVRRVQQGAPATHREVFAQLSIDLAAFTGILLLSGGTANPFVLLYFLHVALFALLLPPRLVVLGTALVLVACTIAAEFSVPLHLRDGGQIPAALVRVARWVSFAVSAAMIAWFVARVSAALQANQGLLEDAARKALNDEAMLRMGTIAAGAAHELSSPLMSMAVIVGEWQRQGVAPQLRRDVDILASQIGACKEALTNLRSAAKAARLDSEPAQPLDAFVSELAGRFRAMRPGVNLKCDLRGPVPAPAMVGDAALKQAILVLLNNAADVSPAYVQLAAHWDATTLEIVVCDRGPGIPTSRLADLGHTFFSTKAPGRGNGLGVMLSAGTVARLGGTITWSNRTEGGARAHMRLPLSALQRNANRDDRR